MNTVNARKQTLAVRRFHRLARTGMLTELRKEQGLSQSDVARFVGVLPSSVSRWEAAKMRALPRHAAAVLKLLEAE